MKKKASLRDARKPLEQRKTGRWDAKEGSKEEMFQRRGTWKSDVHEEKPWLRLLLRPSGGPGYDAPR
jgi:hypothetical protein